MGKNSRQSSSKATETTVVWTDYVLSMPSLEGRKFYEVTRAVSPRSKEKWHVGIGGKILCNDTFHTPRLPDGNRPLTSCRFCKRKLEGIIATFPNPNTELKKKYQQDLKDIFQDLLREYKQTGTKYHRDIEKITTLPPLVTLDGEPAEYNKFPCIVAIGAEWDLYFLRKAKYIKGIPHILIRKGFYNPEVHLKAKKYFKYRVTHEMYKKMLVTWSVANTFFADSEGNLTRLNCKDEDLELVFYELTEELT